MDYPTFIKEYKIVELFELIEQNKANEKKTLYHRFLCCKIPYFNKNISESLEFLGIFSTLIFSAFIVFYVDSLINNKSVYLHTIISLLSLTGLFFVFYFIFQIFPVPYIRKFFNKRNIFTSKSFFSTSAYLSFKKEHYPNYYFLEDFNNVLTIISFFKENHLHFLFLDYFYRNKYKNLFKNLENKNYEMALYNLAYLNYIFYNLKNIELNELITIEQYYLTYEKRKLLNEEFEDKLISNIKKTQINKKINKL